MDKSMNEGQSGPAGSLLRDGEGRIGMPWRVILGWLSFVAALGLAVAVAQVAESCQLPRTGIQILLAVATTGVAVPLIYLLRRFADRRPWSGLGLSPLPSGLPYLLLGAGLLFAMAGVALLTGSALGWLRVVAFHLPAATLLLILINLPIALFYEALPEELAFRGYIYRNLNTRLPRWLALVLQVIFFVLAPVALIAVLAAAGLATWDAITFEYILTLVVFGTALQLSRILSGNLWMCIGYHLAWLETVRYIVVPDSSAIVEVEYVSTNGYFLVYIGSIVLSVLVLLWWSLRRKQPPVDWNGSTPEG
ncbi:MULTISPECIES: CPBP family intramembrane glutamic endopeptidase [Paenibacillus]|uniref:CPBP family intramembrane glutamic endopeptidase n=1 Tax=Paenibacillus TaxID=44249 RepID=UPI0022B9277F|nr:CPBP family intramembrane glutamic endopeptidase [Paenibacillus caseinilyticus]MCZ8521651.1 CPBP family intramembrane metalloprotease [Paenibacillus caseinilyticus]